MQLLLVRWKKNIQNIFITMARYTRTTLNEPHNLSATCLPGTS